MDRLSVPGPIGAAERETRPVTRPAEGPAPLELKGITKSWRGRVVLDAVDLEIERGCVTWLGGRNGAGKTTLLRVAAGLIEAEAGTVRVEGLDPVRDRREFQSRLGYLPAGNGGLYARLSVTRNLEFWGGMGLLRGAELVPVIERALERFGIVDLRDRRVDRLSMGQRQRIRLAATLLHEPDVVLLDEPHTSLDDEGLALLASVIGELRERGASVVWCSPSQGVAELHQDVGIMVEDGKLRPA
jgi:ABC-2 type transport system ATP-binding protein